MAVLILGLLYFIGREDELEGLMRDWLRRVWWGTGKLDGGDPVPESVVMAVLQGRVRENYNTPIGWLTREITETSAGPMWTIEGDSVPVDSGGANDVCLPIFKGFDYPSCPQCAIEGLAYLGWGESLEGTPDHVPGTRKCAACLSVWSDSRYGAAGKMHKCERHPAGV